MAKNVFGQSIVFKRTVVRLFGLVSYAGFVWRNKTQIQGSVRLNELPENNVLLVSNHQTYFADVALMVHAIHSARRGRIDNVKYPGFLFKPKHNLYFVAAEETLKSGILPKIMRYCGAISVKRTWRADGKSVHRPVDKHDVDHITTALSDGWVISFPQGTTKPFMPGRKGTAHLIKQNKPIVLPIVIDGFRRAFDKKGMFFKKKGTTLKVHFKPPLEIDYEAEVDDIMAQVMKGIEQAPEFDQVSDGK
jgi:1-acyl-sn-glycerol-3-phosphate acyltransferase